VGAVLAVARVEIAAAPVEIGEAAAAASAENAAVTGASAQSGASSIAAVLKVRPRSNYRR